MPPHLGVGVTSTDPDKTFEKAESLCLLAVKDPSLVPEYQTAHAAAQALEHTGWKRSTGMTQNQIIMKHLEKAGSITVREALVEYSVASLTKRIQELREAGHAILSTTKHHPITKQRYVRYTLADKFENAA